MNDFFNNFDASTGESLEDFTPDLVPEGEYTAMIVDSETKENSKGTGYYLRLDFMIMEGEYEGRIIPEYCNIRHPSAKVVAIAEKTIRSVCRAIGVLKPQDSSSLHNLPMLIKVKIEKGKEGYGPSNKVVAFKKKGVAEAPTPSSSAPWAQKG